MKFCIILSKKIGEMVGQNILIKKIFNLKDIKFGRKVLILNLKLKTGLNFSDQKKNKRRNFSKKLVFCFVGKI
jgi:hypothetical protein